MMRYPSECFITPGQQPARVVADLAGEREKQKLTVDVVRDGDARTTAEKSPHSPGKYCAAAARGGGRRLWISGFSLLPQN